ncbi:hypothetical protein [Achromobacter kerstersii]|uniref:hypothetical protein n=1 Tax=Achromobacter kerstersii TaxID=1353890 RepID=UPI003D0937FC
MPKLLLRVCDFLLLAGAAALFGACLTSLLATGNYGWAVPDAPYVYTPRDFYADAVLAGLAGLLVLVAAERFAAPRLTPAWRAGLTFVAALLALYLAPPAPIVFGNTWASGEATRELFLAQWRLVLPIALAVTAARWVLRRVFVR